MNVAIIDLGTNTFNILIADINEHNSFEILLNTKSAVMLGKEGINDGYISDKAFTRAYSVIRDFYQMIETFGCKKIVAFGTSAIRSATNARNFIDKIKRDFSIDIEPISGQKEAEYIYFGVRKAVEMDNSSNYLVIDIGGGSVEFIICNNSNIFWKQSFLLGGARLIQRFEPADPVTVEQIEKIYQFFDIELLELKEALKKYPVQKIVGSSGAYDSFAEMLYQAKNKQPMPKNIKTNLISLTGFNQIYQQLVTSTYDDRLCMPGLEPLRVETIVMAALLTKYALSLTNATEIIQSAYSLKEGVAATFNLN